MLTGRPSRLKAFDYTGLHRYFLTFCTDGRRQLFRDRDVVELVLSQISRAASEHGFAILAYCFMPDHLHLLVHGECESSDCSAFISLAKQYSGYHYRQRFETRLWQRYSHERTLREQDDSLAVARYVVENPVRAKLVESVGEYPFVGSQVCEVKDLIASVRSG